jgi:hypothetical protein
VWREFVALNKLGLGLHRVLGITVTLAVLVACTPVMDAASGTGNNAGRSGADQPPAPASGLGAIQAYVIKHAPQKQIETATGKPNAKIGRSPGSACEVMRFLARAIETGTATEGARDKLLSLADWIMSLQSSDTGKPWLGGVPSTPDLPAPGNRYYYTIDAAFCGEAMLRTFQVSADERHLKSAVDFADFLVAMHQGTARQGGSAATGFCEFVIGTGRGTWQCDTFVKNLIALPVLRDVARQTGQERYNATAARARAFLVQGLAGAWEYAEASGGAACKSGSCAPVWRRVQGPHKQRDYFVYGDTLAYGLRGLFDYEGASPTVRKLYADFAGYRGKGAKTKSYDGGIAFAGYMRPDVREPDDFSAYYDLVTLGILHKLRRATEPDHFHRASGVLKKIVEGAGGFSWKMQIDLTVPASDHADLTALANLGEALLVDPL